MLGPGRAELIAQSSEPRDFLWTSSAHSTHNQVVHRGVQPVEGVAKFGNFVHGCFSFDPGTAGVTPAKGIIR